MKKIAFEWLDAASQDMLLIQRNMDEVHLSGLMAFHAQQAIEKSLKALLEANEQSVPKIHSLQRLFEIAKAFIEVDFDEDMVEKLDKLYTDSRYPGDFGLLPNGKPTLDNAKEFYLFAKFIYDKVKSILEVKQ